MLFASKIELYKKNNERDNNINQIEDSRVKKANSIKMTFMESKEKKTLFRSDIFTVSDRILYLLIQFEPIHAFE